MAIKPMTRRREMTKETKKYMTDEEITRTLKKIASGKKMDNRQIVELVLKLKKLIEKEGE
jgi:hypothetical protein